MHILVSDYMRPHLFFILILLFLPLSDAGVQRTTQIKDVLFNGSFIYKSIEVTLTPDNYSSFDMPGYYITEYLPPELEFKGTTADWHSLSNRTLSLMKVLPPSNNFSIKYTLKIPITSTTTNYTFYGTYKDENKNTGEITSTSVTSGSSSSSSSSRTPTPEKTYLTPQPTQTPTHANEEIQIKTISETANLSNFNKEDPIPLLILLVISLIALLGLKHYKKKNNQLIIPVKILPDKTIFINFKIVTLPFKLDIKNTFNITIFPKIKIDKSLPLIAYPTTLIIPPQTESYFNISETSIIPPKEYTGNITINWSNNEKRLPIWIERIKTNLEKQFHK